jgi:predicted acyl esterase
MAGTSYHAITQWLVAALRPPHLKAMVPAEAVCDLYRDLSYHGGILSTQLRGWFRGQVVSVQHGNGEQALSNPLTGQPVTGPERLSAEELARNRVDFWGEIVRRPLDDAWYRERSADWSKVTTPFLSLGNWDSLEEHLRGNLEGFAQAASEQKWLDVHGGNHLAGVLGDHYTRLQRRFFDHFLKGEDNGWEREPRVHLHVRHVDGHQSDRYEHEWPLASTRWTPYYLDPAGGRLTGAPPADGQVTYDALGDGVTFLTRPLEADTEVTGPMVARLWISSATADADLFVRLRVLDPAGEEVVFHDRVAEAFSHVFGANFPPHPIACGWLRASHRKLDPARSLPWRPYHAHDQVQPLTPGEVYQLDVEVLPTAIVVPAGYRLALSIAGHDYGLHDVPENRPPEVFGGKVTVHAGGARPSHLLLPIVPPSESSEATS